MSKYSEKKERQAKEAAAAEEAAKREAKAAKVVKTAAKVATPEPEKPKMDELLDARIALNNELGDMLEKVAVALNECIGNLAVVKDTTQSEERGFYYATFGRLVAAKDKVEGAVNSLKMATAVAMLAKGKVAREMA